MFIKNLKNKEILNNLNTKIIIKKLLYNMIKHFTDFQKQKLKGLKMVELSAF